jgi:hypothetical protein
MTPRFPARLMRRPAEVIHPVTVPSILQLIDAADPTRSRECKPSERLRQQYRERRFLRSFAKGMVLVIACLAVLVHFAT